MRSLECLVTDVSISWMFQQNAVIDIWRMCLSKWYLVAVIKECWQVAISGHGEDLEDLIRNIFIGNPEIPIWVIRLKRNKG